MTDQSLSVEIKERALGEAIIYTDVETYGRSQRDWISPTQLNEVLNANPVPPEHKDALKEYLLVKLHAKGITVRTYTDKELEDARYELALMQGDISKKDAKVLDNIIAEITKRAFKKFEGTA